MLKGFDFYLLFSSSGVTIPVGAIMAWPSGTPPADWLLCNGQSFSSTTYPVLNSILGTNVTPNLRGQFLRGRSGGETLLNAVPWTTGRPRNTAFMTNNPGDHTHDFRITNNDGSIYWNQGVTGQPTGGNNWTNGWAGNRLANMAWPAGGHTHIVNGGGDTETAPDHTYIDFYIKAR